MFQPLFVRSFLERFDHCYRNLILTHVILLRQLSNGKCDDPLKATRRLIQLFQRLFDHLLEFYGRPHHQLGRTGRFDENVSLTTWNNCTQ